MSGRYDLSTMDLGFEGWNIKKQAARILVRHRYPSLPKDAYIEIHEIHSNWEGEVRIDWSAETGSFIWKKSLGGGAVEVSISDFNAIMNEYC